jgi:hypothetical protein
MERVRAEYAEMPGLSITLPQAQRWFSVDRASSEEAFRRLVAGGLLWMTADGRFVRSMGRRQKGDESYGYVGRVSRSWQPEQHDRRVA